MSTYIAKKTDENGHIHWNDTENNTWKTLCERQVQVIEQRACAEFIEGIEQLHIVGHRIPQLEEVSRTLQQLTGWSVTAVPAMITPTEFFDLLAHKKFPAATFIRRIEEIDYLQEPDIFHELFGHCPMITHQGFADFLQKYGEKALASQHQTLLARLFWFTVEFGLIQTKNGVRCFGGGILSSKEETIYAVESSLPVRKKFNLMEILRTPYRVDQLQGTYFVLDSFDQLSDLLEQDIDAAIVAAQSLPEFEIIQVDKGSEQDEWITC